MCPEETSSYYVSDRFERPHLYFNQLRFVFCILLYPFNQNTTTVIYTFPEEVIATEKHFPTKESTLAMVYFVAFLKTYNRFYQELCHITQS